MTGSVKELIRSIRGSKTASEERAVLAKECAKIRSSLNTDNINYRRKNISKLLFINLLGHPTNFGQMECIKLIASSKFSDKRIGYLALNLLLTEDSEVLMLATNSIKIDLNNPNPYVCEMALRSLANIGTHEMLRELQYEIDTLINSNVPNIKKKATICTVRMLRKAAQRNLTPDSISIDLAYSFMKYLEPLISDFDNGVKTAALSLMSVLLDHYTKICDLDRFFTLLLDVMNEVLNPTNTNFSVTIPANTETFTSQQLMSDQYSTDPFLKVKILSLIKQVYLKLLYNTNHPNGDDYDVKLMDYKERLYEIISKIIKSIELRSNMNDVILYECVTTIECEFADERFNELGKQVVEKFMVGFNNNVKYISLGIIKKLHNVHMKYGDSNWTIIVQSFKQRDISIRKKALDVSLKVVNKETLAPIVQYLYEFLLSADDDLKRESMHRIFNCVNLHSDDLAYKLQVFVKIFSIAGNCVQDAILFDFIDLLSSSTEETKGKTTLELVKTLRYNMGQSALVKAALYSIGEYYQLISDELSNLVVINTKLDQNIFSPKKMDNSVGNEFNKKDENNLLDLSTPKNVNGFHSFDKSNEDDFLLDLSSPTNEPNDPNAAEPNGVNTIEDELFSLYGTNKLESSGNDYSLQNNNLEETSEPEKNKDVDGAEMIVEMLENISIGLIAKNLLSECEYLVTCIGKLVSKMPDKVDQLRKILRRFKRHSSPELQQRSCELEIIIQENIMSLVSPVSKRLPDLYTESVDEYLSLGQEKLPEKIREEEPKDEKVGIFDELFDSRVKVERGVMKGKKEENKDDRLVNSIVENITIVSSREKREDEFQQFDPF
uniref:AP-1 complex subunit gamma n=1 Tax=Theileria annulata TaxID=5874 RepID=A0A3B0NEM3_THEAN